MSSAVKISDFSRSVSVIASEIGVVLSEAVNSTLVTSKSSSSVNFKGYVSRNSLFCIRDDASGEIAGVVSIDDDPEVESIPCWSKELQPSAEISRLGVAEKYQNRGIARELLAGAMEELRIRGCKSAHMLVAKDNVKALRSYAKLAFEKVGEYVLQGHDYWCFEKKL